MCDRHLHFHVVCDLRPIDNMLVKYHRCVPRTVAIITINLHWYCGTIFLSEVYVLFIKKYYLYII